jgi:hypothetical protein
VILVPKGVYANNHGKPPRTYPTEIVDSVRRMYLDEGMTVAEVQKALPRGYKAQRIIERHIPERRPAIKRDQAGANNSSWKGQDATYTAFHLRVQVARGKPSRCSACDCTEGRFEWANLTGDYADVNDYIRLCTRCHRRFDARIRAELGRTLSGHVRRRGDLNV